MCSWFLLFIHEICRGFTHIIVMDEIDIGPVWGHLGGIAMANLKDEYTDIKDRKHRVEHFTVHEEDPANRERLKEELFLALTRTEKRIPA